MIRLVVVHGMGVEHGRLGVHDHPVDGRSRRIGLAGTGTHQVVEGQPGAQGSGGLRRLAPGLLGGAVRPLGGQGENRHRHARGLVGQQRAGRPDLHVARMRPDRQHTLLGGRRRGLALSHEGGNLGDELLRGHRLVDEVGARLPHRRDRPVDGGVRGDHHDRERRLQAAHPIEELDPAHPRHLDICDHQVPGLALDLLEPGHRIEHVLDEETAGLEHLGGPQAEDPVVIDQQDPPVGRRGCGVCHLPPSLSPPVPHGSATISRRRDVRPGRRSRVPGSLCSALRCGVCLVR